MTKLANAKEVKKILEYIQTLYVEREDEMKDETNPQIVEMRKRYKDQRQFAGAVLRALDGDFIDLKIYAYRG